ncbi:hypothetical protein GCM10022254_17600 [Actinomadura meridiana]|uniref:Uncharacterized protein n=1 Tax=Actinomadura meridiana TaxID=559626 RepID=A0ABP8BW28_9ACTN
MGTRTISFRRSPNPISLNTRARQTGATSNQARSTALFQLATQIPAAILARTLGISVSSAVHWQQISAADWTSYAQTSASDQRPKAFRHFEHPTVPYPLRHAFGTTSSNRAAQRLVMDKGNLR